MAYRTTYLLVLLLTAFGWSCTPERLPAGDNLLEGKVLTIGHGGAGFQTYRNTVPANTLASVERALRIEHADGVEIDIQMTADGEFFLYHDGQLDGFTNCHGCLSQTSSEALAGCAFPALHGGLNGGTNGSADAPYALTPLDEVLDLLEEMPAQPWLFLNVKSFDACAPMGDTVRYREMAVRLADLLRDRGRLDHTFVETFDQDYLRIQQQVAPDVHIIYDDEDFARGLEVVLTMDYDGLAISNGQVTRAQVQEMHNHGKWLIIWGVKVLGDSRKAIEKGPEAIMTDDIRMLTNLLAP